LARSFAVSLPPTQVPVYPDRCAGCGRAASTRVHFRTWRLFLYVPACRACSWKVGLLYPARRFIDSVVALIAFGFAYFYLLEELHDGLRWWLSAVVAVLCFIPINALGRRFPLRFNVFDNREAGVVEYHFLDAAYADEFARLNGVESEFCIPRRRNDDSVDSK
jgi:hypothetical protein